MKTETVQASCPKCGAPVPATSAEGLCPRCLLAAATSPTEAGQPSGARANVPSVERVAAAFPHLEILELIGVGGMGAVFKARQPKLDRYVALKILPESLAQNPAFAERFQREGRVLACLTGILPPRGSKTPIQTDQDRAAQPRHRRLARR